MQNIIGRVRLEEEHKKILAVAIKKCGLLFPNSRMVINTREDMTIGSIEYEKIVLR